MTGRVRGFAIRALMPLAWRMNPQRAATVLKVFSDTEADSAWQYLRAMLVAEDDQLKRMLFENVLEEFRHSDYFNAASSRLSRGRIDVPTNERSRLAKTPEDLPYFLAYAHKCERSIHDQFDSYARACDIKDISEVFRRIQEDEREHESEAAKFLTRNTDVRGGRRLLFKVKAVRMTESYLRGSQVISDTILALLLRTIFIIYGALIFPLRQRAR